MTVWFDGTHWNRTKLPTEIAGAPDLDFEIWDTSGLPIQNPAKIPRPHPVRPYTACELPSHPMPVAQLTLEIRIDHAQSLKDRRHVVRSLKDQLRQSFNVSVAEMDEATLWNSATLGIVAISRSRDYLHGLMEELERAAR